MKKILIHISAIFVGLFTTAIVKAGENIQEGMLPGSKDTTGVVVNRLDGADGEDQVTSLLSWVRDTIDGLLPIAAVGVLIFVGIRLGLARGNAEEFKKAWQQFLYVIVGVFIIGFAWGAVKLVSGLNIS
ncbi:MAG: hypothetical protein GY828_04070 [Candidatus Gracilibacteria bacterium]|nr:hypothetical protein [Candidatus Gracilibacteria bacterium]